MYSSDGVARACLNKIPQKFTKVLAKQGGKSLKVILDQVSKIEYKPVQDNFYWVFPSIMRSNVTHSADTLVDEFPDPADFMIGFFAVECRNSQAKK